MTVANAMTDRRSKVHVPAKSRRKCYCGCNQRATHLGLANGVVMMTGCELSVLRWVKNPRDALRAAIWQEKNIQRQFEERNEVKR